MVKSKITFEPLDKAVDLEKPWQATLSDTVGKSMGCLSVQRHTRLMHDVFPLLLLCAPLDSNDPEKEAVVHITSNAVVLQRVEEMEKEHGSLDRIPPFSFRVEWARGRDNVKYLDMLPADSA